MMDLNIGTSTHNYVAQYYCANTLPLGLYTLRAGSRTIKVARCGNQHGTMAEAEKMSHRDCGAVFRAVDSEVAVAE